MKKFLFALTFIIALAIVLPVGQNNISIAGEDDRIEWNSDEKGDNLS